MTTENLNNQKKFKTNKQKKNEYEYKRELRANKSEIETICENLKKIKTNIKYKGFYFNRFQF